MKTHRVKLEHSDESLMVHRESACSGPCPLHARTLHGMRHFPQHWREDRAIIERVCHHGIGHPDPDDNSAGAGGDSGDHGCDGCCA